MILLRWICHEMDLQWVEVDPSTQIHSSTKVNDLDFAG